MSFFINISSFTSHRTRSVLAPSLVRGQPCPRCSAGCRGQGCPRTISSPTPALRPPLPRRGRLTRLALYARQLVLLEVPCRGGWPQGRGGGGNGTRAALPATPRRASRARLPAYQGRSGDGATTEQPTAEGGKKLIRFTGFRMRSEAGEIEN